jgi:hypothetical protein
MWKGAGNGKKPVPTHAEFHHTVVSILVVGSILGQQASNLLSKCHHMLLCPVPFCHLLSVVCSASCHHLDRETMGSATAILPAAKVQGDSDASSEYRQGFPQPVITTVQVHTCRYFL